MYLISFYVPESHLEIVKNSLFEIGAGRYNNYDCCCYQIKGEGQFRPLVGSKPFIGEENQITKVIEYKVEIICNDHLIDKAISQLLKNHPYEEPAYYYIKIN